MIVRNAEQPGRSDGRDRSGRGGGRRHNSQVLVARHDDVGAVAGVREGEAGSGDLRVDDIRERHRRRPLQVGDDGSRSPRSVRADEKQGPLLRLVELVDHVTI